MRDDSQPFTIEDKPVFIKAYVSSFLASYAAVEYTDTCMRGNHDRYDNQPVEDALFLANLAWASLVKLEIL